MFKTFAAYTSRNRRRSMQKVRKSKGPKTAQKAKLVATAWSAVCPLSGLSLKDMVMGRIIYAVFYTIIGLIAISSYG